MKRERYVLPPYRYKVDKVTRPLQVERLDTKYDVDVYIIILNPRCTMFGLYDVLLLWIL